MSSSLVSLLEADFRNLAQDARKADGIAGFFTSAPNPEVKEAAERAVLRVCSFAEHEDPIGQVRAHSKELLKPLQLACETKTSRLIRDALTTLQKLLYNDAISPEGVEAAIAMLSNVERSSDQDVQLKTLQTALALLQSPKLRPTTEDGLSQVLGVCFRMLSSKGHNDTVVSTAAATVRQVVAIVFSYVDASAEVARLKQQAQEAAEGMSEHAASPTLLAAQKLLDDLVAMASGGAATWLKGSSLPRTLALEILDFVIIHSAPLFQELPAFQHILVNKVTQLLQAQLQDHLDAGAAGSSMANQSFSSFKAVLKCMRTLLVAYHTELGPQCGTLVQATLRGLGPKYPYFQRIATAQLAVQILANPRLVYFLFSTFDAQDDRKLDAVHALVRGITDIVDGTLKDRHAIESVAAMYHSKTGGGGGGIGGTTNTTNTNTHTSSINKETATYATLHTEYESASKYVQSAYLTKLAVDSLSSLATSIELLADAATDGGGQLNGVVVVGGGGGVMSPLSPSSPPIAGETGGPGGGSLVERSLSGGFMANTSSVVIDAVIVKVLVDRLWRSILAVLASLLDSCASTSTCESLIIKLLRGYQSLTQSAGLLDMEECRDALLSGLCEAALSSDDGGKNSNNNNNSGGGGLSLTSVFNSISRSTGSGGGGGGDASIGSPGGGGKGAGGGAGASPIHSRSASEDGYPGGGGGGEYGLSAITLSMKNIQCMRTLFNIARRLSSSLGPSGWTLVLTTVNSLDLVLDSPRTTAASEGGGGDDLSILSAAAAQLFQATKVMDRNAVVALLSGLRDVSIRSIPFYAQVAAGQPKLYALDRMVEVVLNNVFRIYDLWAVFLSHCLEVIEDPKPPVRAAAIDALGRAIVGSLGEIQQGGGLGSAGGNVGGGGGGTTPPQQQLTPIRSTLPPQSSSSSSGGVEHMLLVALESLYNDDREKDVKSGVLNVLLMVLQRHGERLTDGWTPIFRLLGAVPASGEAESIDIAFQCINLIIGDHLSAMQFVRLRKCLEVAALYGSQQEDLNVSLTTISLLWNAADMFSRSAAAFKSASATGGGVGKTPDRSSSSYQMNVGNNIILEGGDASITQYRQEEEEEDKDGSPITQQQQRLQTKLTPSQTEELLRLVFSALNALSRDPRPEVRNSGVRTLFAVVLGQGPRLSKPLWNEALWDMLFPLLSHAFHKSATSSREESEAAVLGNSRGQEVRMVVHHSRNSEQKQWDETVVIALGGMARLLRAHLPTVASLGAKSIGAGWDELMVVAESGMAGGRKEVALAAIALLGAVLSAHGADPGTVSDAMWRRALRVIDVGVEASTTGNCQVPLPARVDLLALIGQVFCNPALQPRLTDADVLGSFKWVEAFCKNPWSDGDSSSLVQTVGMPLVQKAALALLPTLEPGQHVPHLWPEFIWSVTRLVKPDHIIESWNDTNTMMMSLNKEPRHGDVDSVAGGQQQQHQQQQHQQQQPKLTPAPSYRLQERYALTSDFLKKMMEVLLRIYTDAPMQVQAATFGAVVRALSRCMQIRYSVYEESLWRAACMIFNSIVPMGLHSLCGASKTAAGTKKGSSSSITLTEQDIDDAWAALAESFESFLLGVGVELVGNHNFDSIHSPNLSPTSSFTKSTSNVDEFVKGGSRRNSGILTDSLPTAEQQQLLRSDTDLEASLLDTLTDAVLTCCSTAPPPAQRRLVAIVDAGCARLRTVAIPGSSSESTFRQICLRKMYVLCARTTTSNSDTSTTSASPTDTLSTDAASCQLTIARMALPMFLSRCDSLLRNYIEIPPPPRGDFGAASPINGNSSTRPKIEEVMCVLEVLATMTLEAGVVDAVLPDNEWITDVVKALRARPDAAQRGRERSHLLLVYPALCGCISAREVRVREMVKDILQLAGAELGLGVVKMF